MPFLEASLYIIILLFRIDLTGYCNWFCLDAEPVSMLAKVHIYTNTFPLYVIPSRKSIK